MQTTGTMTPQDEAFSQESPYPTATPNSACSAPTGPCHTPKTNTSLPYTHMSYNICTNTYRSKTSQTWTKLIHLPTSKISSCGKCTNTNATRCTKHSSWGPQLQLDQHRQRGRPPSPTALGKQDGMGQPQPHTNHRTSRLIHPNQLDSNHPHVMDRPHSHLPVSHHPNITRGAPRTLPQHHL